MGFLLLEGVKPLFNHPLPGGDWSVSPLELSAVALLRQHPDNRESEGIDAVSDLCQHLDLVGPTLRGHFSDSGVPVALQHPLQVQLGQAVCVLPGLILVTGDCRLEFQVGRKLQNQRIQYVEATEWGDVVN